ncbi:MAG: M50 family metallopeptidase [Prevotella sp.]|nr:M50 family metallopeptidase [Prevotella sp.]
MKKILKGLTGLLIGIAIGLCSMKLIFWMVDGGKPLVESASKGTDYGLLAVSIILAFVWLFVTVMIHLILHEAGHLVMGLLTGYRFLSFRVFKLTLAKTEAGLQWKRYHIAGTGGQCLMELPEDQDVDKAPWFWYNAGGVMMNVLLVLVSIFVLRTTELGIVGFSFFVMLAFVGIVMTLMNGIPMFSGGVGNDAHHILSLWRHPELRLYFVRTLQTAGQLTRGKRLKELPEEWFADKPATKDSPALEIANRVNFMTLLEDQGRLGEALKVGEELMSLGKELPQIYQLEVGGERVMLELLTLNRTEVVDELWTSTVEKYTVMNSNYSPIKCAVLFAYELLFHHDKEKAEAYSEILQLHQDKYAMAGEARTAISLVESAREVDARRQGE